MDTLADQYVVQLLLPSLYGCAAHNPLHREHKSDASKSACSHTCQSRYARTKCAGPDSPRLWAFIGHYTANCPPPHTKSGTAYMRHVLCVSTQGTDTRRSSCVVCWRWRLCTLIGGIGNLREMCLIKWITHTSGTRVHMCSRALEIYCEKYMNSIVTPVSRNSNSHSSCVICGK